MAANTKWNDDLAQVNNAARQAVRAAKNAKEDAKTVKRAAGKAAAGNWMGAAVDMLKSPRATQNRRSTRILAPVLRFSARRI